MVTKMINEDLKGFLKNPFLTVEKLLMKVFRHGYTHGVYDFYEFTLEVIKTNKNKQIKKEEIEHILSTVFDKCINQNKKEFLVIEKGKN